jgi:hypothetical protein
MLGHLARLEAFHQIPIYGVEIGALRIGAVTGLGRTEIQASARRLNWAGLTYFITWIRYFMR